MTFWEVLALNRVTLDGTHLHLSETLEAVAFNEDQARMMGEQIATICQAQVIRCRIRPLELSDEQAHRLFYDRGLADARDGLPSAASDYPAEWQADYSNGYDAGKPRRVRKR